MLHYEPPVRKLERHPKHRSATCPTARCSTRQIGGDISPAAGDGSWRSLILGSGQGHVAHGGGRAKSLRNRLPYRAPSGSRKNTRIGVIYRQYRRNPWTDRIINCLSVALLYPQDHRSLLHILLASIEAQRNLELLRSGWRGDQNAPTHCNFKSRSVRGGRKAPSDYSPHPSQSGARSVRLGVAFYRPHVCCSS